MCPWNRTQCSHCHSSRFVSWAKNQPRQNGVNFEGWVNNGFWHKLSTTIKQAFLMIHSSNLTPFGVSICCLYTQRGSKHCTQAIWPKWHQWPGPDLHPGPLSSLETPLPLGPGPLSCNPAPVDNYSICKNSCCSYTQYGCLVPSCHPDEHGFFLATACLSGTNWV